MLQGIYTITNAKQCYLFLIRCTCTVGYLGQEESRASVLESFLVARAHVHYFGVASLLNDAKRGRIDGHFIASFYKTVSTLQDTSQGIKLQFPLGGYWQQN